MEPDKSWCDLAAEWQQEEAAERAAMRFAHQVERIAAKLGIPRSKVANWLSHAGDFAAMTALGAA